MRTSNKTDMPKAQHRTDGVCGLLDMIGETPLLPLSKMGNFIIYGKAEFFNPGGSVKDRVGKHLITEAERDGSLRKGMRIVEASSGNTGIGLALVGGLLGYKVSIVMPEDMSVERKKIMAALGAEVILTPSRESIQGCVDRVREMANSDSNIWVPAQFDNPRNPEVHYNTTAREIFRQMDGRIDAFVAGVGSGGTIQGVGSFLKERLPEVHIAAVEPANSAALLGHEPGLHKIHGIGDGFIPSVLDVDMLDEVITVTDDEAVETTRRIARAEGMLCGTSSGANVWAAMRVAEKLGPDSRVVTVLADRAERYFSTALI